ncbi:MAG: pantoate--beta-alanine ligase [Dehalococcoidia bacterium]|nr:pantoate--beta-alanine ligase [Dehalococcoidia bacterium]
MLVLRSVDALRAARGEAAALVGFVPTMGFLHEGHLSLVTAARAECRTVVASIFVNPTQFGPGEDFERYPRDEPRDLALLEAAGVDLVLVPPVEELYPPGDATRVTVPALSSMLEGARRPGHFDGVATVVAKLFHIVRPDLAYFGQKDAQQLTVITRMARDLLLPVTVVGCPTVREPDGLACSSRNVYLSPEQRAQAVALSAGLRAAEAAFAAGERDAEALRRAARAPIEAQPLASVDYLSLADAASLAELSGVVAGPALLSMAVAFGPTHLLDNTTLRP